MTTISSAQSIDMTNVAYVLTRNHGGTETPLTPPNIQNIENSFATLSTITTYNIAGVSTLYVVDISGTQNLSTIAGLSAMAAVEVNIADIINSHNVFIQIEQQNKTNLNSLNFTTFKTTMYKWAALNYPASFLAYSFPVTTPPMTGGLYSCSDGTPRSIWDYIPFFLNKSIQDWLAAYQTKVSGINLTFSINADPYVINIHVTRP
jgi:hypothetical protein